MVMNSKTKIVVVGVVIVVLIVGIILCLTLRKNENAKRQAVLKMAMNLSQWIEQELRRLEVDFPDWKWGDQLVSDASAATRAVDYFANGKIARIQGVAQEDQQQHCVVFSKQAMRRILDAAACRSEIQTATDTLDRVYDLESSTLTEIDRLNYESSVGGGGAEEMAISSRLEMIQKQIEALKDLLNRNHRAVFDRMVQHIRSCTNAADMTATQEKELAFEVVAVQKCLDELSPQILSMRKRELTGIAAIDERIAAREHEMIHTKMTRINDCRQFLSTFEHLVSKHTTAV